MTDAMNISGAVNEDDEVLRRAHQRIADLEAALREVAPEHPLLNEGSTFNRDARPE